MVNSSEPASSEHRILKAAKTVFLKKGMEGARMQEIAEEAGINKALLHYYFRNKKMLFLAIFKSEFARFGPKIFQLFNSESSVEQKLHDVVDAYMDMLSDNPFLPVFIISEIHHSPELIQDLEETLQMIRSSSIVRQLQEGAARGVYAPVAPEQFFTNLLGLCIFPFLAKPLLMRMFLKEENNFAAFIRERKRLIPEMVLKSIKSN